MLGRAVAFLSQEPYHSAFYYATTACSLFSNAVLIFVIVKTQFKEIGAYRYLLMMFAISDALTSLTNLATQPFIHMTPFFYWFIPSHRQGWMPHTVPIDYALILLDHAFFFNTIILIAFHFVYRYVALTPDHTILGFGKDWSTRRWVATGALITVLFIGTIDCLIVIFLLPIDHLPFEQSQEEMKGNREATGVIILHYLDMETKQFVAWEAIIAMSIVFFLSACAFNVIIYCAVGILKMLSRSVMHETTRRLQRQLFRALLVQTAVPMLLSFLPLTLIIVIPMAGVEIEGASSIGTALIMTMAIFPAIDALFIIGFVGRYRATFLRYLAPCFVKEKASPKLPLFTTRVSSPAE